MPISSGNIDSILEFIAEGEAEFVRWNSVPTLHGREIVRRFPGERNVTELIEDAFELLDSYGSVAAYSAAVYRDWIDAPQVRGESLPGRWRIIKTEKESTENEAEDGDRAISGIVQTLRYGYYSESDISWGTPGANGISDAVTFLDARVIRETDSDNTLYGGAPSYVPNTPSPSLTTIAYSYGDDPDRMLTVELLNIDPESVEDLLYHATTGLLSRNIRGFSNFVCRGKTYAGTFNLISTRILESELSSDGSVRLQLVLAKPQFTLNAYRTYLKIFSTGTREEVVHYLWSVPKFYGQAIVNEWKANGRSAQVSFSRDDNLINIVLSEIVYSGAFKFTTETTSRVNCSSQTYEALYWGVYDPGNYDINVFAGRSWTYDRDVRFLRDEGRFDVIVRATKSKERTQPFLPVGNAVTSVSYEYNQTGVYSPTDILTIDSAAAGIAYSRRLTFNEDCTYDAATRVDISISKAPQFTRARTLFVTTEAILYRNHRAMPSAPSSIYGSGAYQVTVSMEADGTYSGMMTYTSGTATGDARYRATATAVSDAYGILYRGWPKPISVPESPSFGLYRIIAQTLTSEGLYDGVMLYEYPDEQQTFFNQGRTFFTTRSAIMYDHWKGKLNTPPYAPNVGAYSLQSALNDDGSYSGILSYITGNGKGNHGFTSQFAPLETAVDHIYTDYPNPLAPAHTEAKDGFIYEAGQTIGADGLYGGSVRTRKAIRRVVAVGGSLKSDAAVLSTTTRALRKNISQIELFVTQPTGSVGQRQEMTFEMNQFGLYDNVSNTITSTPVAYVADWSTVAGTAFSYTYLNQRSAVDLSAFGLTRQNNVVLSYNTDGSMDIKATSLPVSLSGGSTVTTNPTGFYHFAFSAQQVSRKSTNDFALIAESQWFLPVAAYHYIRYAVDEKTAWAYAERGMDGTVSSSGGAFRSDTVVWREIGDLTGKLATYGIGIADAIVQAHFPLGMQE